MKVFTSLFGILCFVTLFQPQPAPRPPFKPQTLEASISQSTTVVQFNSEWNSGNEYRWVDVPGVKYFYIDLEKYPMYRDKMGIKSLPTLIIFKQGREVKRYEGGLMMKINTPFQTIQKSL